MKMKGDGHPEHRAGAPEDLSKFAAQEYGPLVEMLSLYCGRGDVAEEFAQEALIRLCRDWHKVRKMEHPSAWLKRVAINVARSHFRRRAAEKKASLRLESKTTEQHHPDSADSVAVRKAVSSLPQRQKTVLLLHYYGDLTFNQISEYMNCSENTAKSLARRAIRSLRERGGLVETKEATNV